MSISADKIAAHSDEGHGVRNVRCVFLAIALEQIAPPSAPARIWIPGFDKPSVFVRDPDAPIVHWVA